MTPAVAELNMSLTAVQIMRTEANGGRYVAMDCTLVPLDDIGRRFCCLITFPCGDITRVDFRLPAPVDLGDSEWCERLDCSLFDEAPRWRH